MLSSQWSMVPGGAPNISHLAEYMGRVVVRLLHHKI